MAKTYLENLLSQNEKILLSTRQHWFTLASAIFFEIAAIIIIFATTVTSAIFFQEYALIIAAVGFLLMLIPIGTMTRDILLWTNHQYLVTNRRVMQLSGVINKSVIDSSLEKVNDVKMEQSALGRMFGYGDIEILTASEMGMNQFKKIEDPVGFKTAMLNAKETLEMIGIEKPREDGIPELIATLEHFLTALAIEGVILAEPDLSEESARQVRSLCLLHDCWVRRLRLEFEAF